MFVDIAGRRIGQGEPPFVVAEAGVNHNGSMEMALELVDAAVEAGADAVKFQTFSAEAVVLDDAPQAAYQFARDPAGSQLEMLRRLELPANVWPALQARASKGGIVFFSTPFDLAAVELLADLGVPAFKVGSGDLTNLVLLRAVAAHGRPVLLSTGMADMAEIESAVADLRGHGDPPLALLQCTSAYPASTNDANLRAIATLRDRFRVPVGYSDHTLGIATATAAAALGAALIEKHLTLDRTSPGPDHAASLEPGEFARMTAAIRDVDAALGDGVKARAPDEEDTRRAARRSLVVTRPLTAGAAVIAADLDAMRPADGISPLRLDAVVGRRATRDLAGHQILQPTDLDPPLEDPELP
jgi:N-acetylneuraminate synthase/N,N'-diacetyllegionaminate synthase